ncbi:MAG: Fe-S cluster assembly ATPase SufC [Candidatus Diapherotrites archaeon]|uniref:Fe-S cluster assembly ATPase SufC n=1 Tax=Candidatus Iainarchaeum sp. TaxID=3101447 RepID=A0A8T4L6D5_9ARCH|nr:Fe-S cluster assembly ATPase SufC [Candidatus Diapherotrites archaeon]
MDLLSVKDLHAQIDGKNILNGIDLSVKKGEVHAIMGPNGSGKSTLSNVIMGHPKFVVTKGSISFEGKDVLELSPDKRSRLGLFLSFQYPFEVQGLGFSKFLFSAYKARFPNKKISVLDFQKLLKSKAEALHMTPEFTKRELNVGFSGGEKKRAEILQLMMLEPKLAILDETDSGLDIDSLKLVAESVNRLRGPDFSAIVITHYKRILNYLKPDVVHVLSEGRIVASGDMSLADELEANGYKTVLQKSAMGRGAEK